MHSVGALYITTHSNKIKKIDVCSLRIRWIHFRKLFWSLTPPQWLREEGWNLKITDGSFKYTKYEIFRVVEFIFVVISAVIPSYPWLRCEISKSGTGYPHVYQIGVYWDTELIFFKLFQQPRFLDCERNCYPKVKKVMK